MKTARSPLPTIDAAPVEGYIGYYGLEDWWQSAFTPDERALVQATLKPRLSGPGATLTTGSVQSSSENVGQFLTVLAQWFGRKDLAPIGVKILDKAKSSCKGVLDKHLWLSSYIELRYAQRDADPTALDDVIRACEDMIALAPKASQAFKKAYLSPVPPSHRGYGQLITIYKARGDRAEARRLQEEFLMVWR